MGHLLPLLLLLAAAVGCLAQDPASSCGAGTYYNERSNMCEVYYPGGETQILAIDDNLLLYTRSGRKIGES